MKGFVPTPPQLVDAMVSRLFATRRPHPDETLLDPGCGTGAFIEGVLRWGAASGSPVPRIVGIDSDPNLLAQARERVGASERVTLVERDFLANWRAEFDYVIGNPPYVAITALTVDERATYRSRFRSAVGRFDLYLLFFEQALRLLKPNGRLVFVTPEKFLYVQTAEPLRQQLTDTGVEEIEFASESSFGDLVTYPTITTVAAGSNGNETRITLRDGVRREVRLPGHASWLPLIRGGPTSNGQYRLANALTRVSCGVATGADSVYVLPDAQIPEPLRPYAFRTIAGRQLGRMDGLRTTHSMLVPYHRDGRLLRPAELGPLDSYLRDPQRHAQLMRRICVNKKPWYAFHENPPLQDLLRPKILCKDIGLKPQFVIDEVGDIVPRHSVYYLVPADPSQLVDLGEFLNSTDAVEWLMGHCQRAANGFVRLQSHVLRELPIPERFLPAGQLACV